MEKSLEDLYHQYWKIHNDLIESGYTPLQIAGVLSAHAMTIYKTILSEDEFNLIIDSISNSRDKVHKLTTEITLQ
jgi:hypothetical protein